MLASRTFRLDSDEDTLLFQSVDGAMPALVYWGPRLDADEGAGVWAERPVPNGALDSGEALSILPEAGRGFFGHPGISVHRGGRDFVTQFMLHRTEEAPERLLFELRDAIAALDVRLELTIDAATGMVASRTTIANVGEPGLEVQWLASCALPVPHAEMMLFDGRWGFEFQPVRQTLKSGAFVKENRTGRTSHFSWPFLVAGEAGFSDTTGEVFAFHLGWSGDHKLVAGKLRDGRIQVQAGALFAPGEIILGVNESHVTPTAYATRSAHGLNGLSDRFHPFVRDRILGGRLKGKTRQVHFNSWEAVYFDHDSEKLKQLVDLAADVGVERFVLDDGWFAGRPTDKSGLGDWRVDPAKYPNGLKPLIDHVHARGMSFGLWVEPEMANADSDLLREHPDWTLHVEGRTQPLGRGQYVLDLTRKDVWDNIFGQIDALLREYEIAYLKWDMNRDLTHAASLGRPASDAQTRSVYRLIDALRAAHPKVEIESCSSGGGRADFGILTRTGRIWTSDCNDPIDRQHIQRAFSYFLPPEIMGSHVGARRSHTTGRVTGIAMRAFTAFFGHMGIEADISQMDTNERERLADIIALHKQCRGIIHSGRVTRLAHDDPACCAFMVSDSGKTLISVAQLDTPRLMPHLPLRLSGLNESTRYKVQLLNPQPRVRMKSEPATIRGESFTVSGAVLMHAGLTLPMLMVGEIAVFAVERERVTALTDRFPTRFRERFGTTPRLFRAPGRINIIGEHTDYTGGLVMPAAIDRWCTIAAAPNGTRKLNVIAASFGKEAQADLDALKPDGSWMDYVAGVAAVLMQNGIAVPGADLIIESDVPVGAGVSSSAALEVSVTHALLALANAKTDGVRIAQWAQAAENSFAGMPCGIMDQFASANGHADAALLLDCRSLAVRTVPLPREAAFLIVNSMVKHAHTEGEYRSRRADCETAAQILGVQSLRDIDVAALPAALAKLPDGPAKRCRHVVTENARVEAAAVAMAANDLPALGALLNASHASLRDDMEVSVPQVDELAAIAQKTPGVFGARMMGGGFGGCVIALVAASQGETVQAAIVERYARVIGTNPDAFICRAVDGAGEIAA